MGAGSKVSRQKLACTVVLTLITTLWSASESVAQVGATASIVGQVTDESKGVLPGVTVTATSTALQVKSVVDVTNEAGEYRLTTLPIGTYIVEYTLPGFQTVRQEGVRLTAGFTAKLDIILKVGALEETVTVSGAAPVVDTASTTVTTHVTKEVLEIIPTGRNGYTALMEGEIEALEREQVV